jgi:hypothetical protein
VPTKAELLKDATALLLFSWKKLGESKIEILTTNPYSLRVTSKRMNDLFIDLDASGVGHWGELRKGNKVLMGNALLPKPT